MKVDICLTILLMTAVKVYSSGLRAELMGKTTTIIQAYTSWGTDIPKKVSMPGMIL
jgi:hypothetical protein